MDKMRSEYRAILLELPPHLTPDEAVRAAVSERFSEPANIILLTPPAPPSDYRDEPDAAARERIHQMLAAKVKTYTKRV